MLIGWSAWGLEVVIVRVVRRMDVPGRQVVRRRRDWGERWKGARETERCLSV